MSGRVLAFAAAVAATVTLTTTSALASTSAPAATPHPSVITAQGAAQPAADCSRYATNGKLLGTIICGYGVSYAYFPNGTQEEFVVGTSHAVWTAWNNTSGSWSEKSMGGLAYSAVTVKKQSGYALEITVLSSSGGTYCNFRGGLVNSGWSGWSSGDC